ncbi:MAG: hypothetical protein ABH829_02205 [archaeon]
MNYETAFKKPVTDVKKLVIGVILGMIPVIHWIAKGFYLNCSNVGKVKTGDKMPEWTDSQLFSSPVFCQA